jgi:hypothetical protein
MGVYMTRQATQTHPHLPNHRHTGHGYGSRQSVLIGLIRDQHHLYIALSSLVPSLHPPYITVKVVVLPGMSQEPSRARGQRLKGQAPKRDMISVDLLASPPRGQAQHGMHPRHHTSLPSFQTSVHPD